MRIVLIAFALKCRSAGFFCYTTMYAALTKAGVPASFIRIEGAGHGFGGADLERVNAAMVQWFERHLRGAVK